MEGQESYPLPEDPALAEVAAALRDTGHWAWIVDDRWHAVYVTDELRLTFGAGVELAPWAIGAHIFGPEAMSASMRWRFGANTTELNRMLFAFLGGWMRSLTRRCATWSISSLPQILWRGRSRGPGWASPRYRWTSRWSPCASAAPPAGSPGPR